MLLFYCSFAASFALLLFLVPCVLDYQFSLVVLYDGFLSFLFIYRMCLCSDYLFSGYHEVCIKDLIDEIGHFLMASFP